jgi:hypothetical protein
MPPSAPATPAWVKTILRELHGISPDSFGPFAHLANQSADAPAWARRVEQEIEKGLFPGLNIDALATISPAHLGTVLGQQCANFASLASVGECLQKLPAGPSANEAQMKRATARASDKLTGITQKATRHALRLALKQPHAEAAPFFQAFADAFARQPSGHGSNLGTTAFPVYLWLLILQPLMPQFQSIGQLHDVLKKILGRDLAGDRKRIEKICQRLGLRFRPPGRPKNRGLSHAKNRVQPPG